MELICKQTAEISWSQAGPALTYSTLKSYSRCSFSCVAPVVWNNIPISLSLSSNENLKHTILSLPQNLQYFLLNLLILLGVNWTMTIVCDYTSLFLALMGQFSRNIVSLKFIISYQVLVRKRSALII